MQKGYFPIYITGVYAESLGSWGTINSDIATEISNCMVDFADTSLAGERNLLTSWGKTVMYRNCNFRYYGKSTPLPMQGNCIFDNCFFSGKLVQSNATAFALRNVITDPYDKRSLVSIILLTVAASVIVICFFLFLYLRQRKKYKQLKSYKERI